MLHILIKFIAGKKASVFMLLMQSLFFIGGHSQITSFYFRHLTNADGLSDGVVNAIMQDKYGFIWIGTSYGLNRFDGTTVKTYFSNSDDTCSITNNYIQSLYLDRDGNLWVGTLQGLCRFNYTTNQFVRYSASSPLLIRDIMQDKKGQIWVGTESGLWITDNKNLSIQKFTPPGNAGQKEKFQFAVLQIISSPGGDWYLATKQGIKIFDPVTAAISEIRHDTADKFSLSSDLVSSIGFDSLGCLWAACISPKSILNKIDLKNHTIKYYDRFINPQKKWSSNILRKIMTDKKGRIWVTSVYSGLSLYDEKKDDFDDYTSDLFIPNSLLANSNASMYQDSNGIMWLGTLGYGLSYFNPEKNFFYSIYPVTGTNSLSEGTWGRSACEDKQGNLWLAMGMGLVKYDRAKRVFTNFLNTDEKKSVIQYNSTRALLEDDIGDIWIGTAKGLNRYHPSDGVMDFFDNKQGIPLAFFWMIVKDKNGIVWLGSASGLYRYNRSKNYFDDLSKDSLLSKYAHKNIQALYVDSHNRLWIGILNVGLVMYDVDNKREKFLTMKDSLISDTRFSSFAEDRDGVIWIGAENGLTAYNPVTNHSHFFTHENGLTSDRTNNIMVDSMNRIWIGTSNGLCMLNEKRDRVKKFDMNDGLITTQFNEQSAYRTRDGLFIYPTYRGFVVFHPEDYHENVSTIPIYITSFKVSNKEITGNTESLQNIHLRYNENFFNIELAGLNYMNPSQCMYAYKLEPFDESWIFTSKREINYTNVPAGNYTFRYKVITDNPDWDVPEKTLQISIGQIFYRTNWFKGLILLIIASAAIAFSRFRHRQREKILVLQNKTESLEKEKVLVQFENLKQQLNPHFLFNSLTSLRSLIRVDSKTATHFLDGLSKTYRYLLRSGSNELVPLKEELNFVETFTDLQKTRFKEGLQININVDPVCNNKYIAPVTLQNLVENAIKHNTTSEESPLVIDIFTEDGYIIIKNNLQRYRIVETSNKRGLSSMQSLYKYFSDKPVIITEDKNYFLVKIPLI